VVRDALPEDAAAIRAVALRAWPAAYAGLFAPGYIEHVLESGYALDVLERQLADTSAVFLVACEDDGTIIGFLHYGEGELRRLYVEPDRIGQGIGAALLAELNRRLPAGTAYVALVREGNDRALRFYDRHGFERAGLVDGLAHFAEREGYEPPGTSPRGRDVLVRYVVP
jgi:ribosomal protein S18 acetylase RimI-like enzyme